MPRFPATAALAIALSAMSLTSTALHAQEPDHSHGKEGPMTSPGMKDMMRNGSGMMDHCSNMMQGNAGRPNDQWRNGAPSSNGRDEKRD